MDILLTAPALLYMLSCGITPLFFPSNCKYPSLLLLLLTLYCHTRFCVQLCSVTFTKFTLQLLLHTCYTHTHFCTYRHNCLPLCKPVQPLCLDKSGHHAHTA